MRSAARFVFSVYFILVIAGVALAILRLSESAEMPGLQAIELVILALPWSLALGVEPFSRVGLSGMVMIDIVGIMVNGLVLRSIVLLFARHCTRF